MNPRNLPSCLLSTSSLLFYLINLCNSAAPADLPSDCPTPSTNQRVLLDSCCYPTLLLPERWSTNDADSDGMTWTESNTGDSSCPRSVMISSATDDWLITQYIDTTLNGESAGEVVVSIQFTCTENCSSNLDLLYYPTNTELGLPPLNSFMLVGQAQNGNNQLTGISTSGFYLAIRAMGGITVTIDRISVTATVCREDTVNLISFPEAYPSSTAVDGSCSDVNSEQGPDSGGLTGMCSSNGIWITSSSCVCRAGHFLDNVACSACPVETYKSTAGNEECSPCPRNSNASSMGSISCSCNPNYRRPNSNATDEDCSECGDGFFFTGGSCQPCPGNSTSSGGTGGSCTCRMNYTILNGESTTSGEDCVCRENYHINSNQCVSCPANSFRAITPLHISMCMCDSKRSTTDGNTTTSGSVPCDGCRPGHFLSNGMCLVCPENSNSTLPSSSSCTCKGQSVTMTQSPTTTMESCSTCPVNWKGTEPPAVVCEMCPVRSVRPEDQAISNCTCMDGYKMKSSMCLAEVIIPSGTLTVEEGSAENPARITLSLSAESYHFDVIINIDPPLPDPIPTPTNILFEQGVTQASIEIPGNDVALNNSYGLTVRVLGSDDYIGDGEFEVTVVDDDPVSVGFLDSQRKQFNESEDTIFITLTKTATTAQDIEVRLVAFPQDSSVSVGSGLVSLAAGPPGNVTVMLRIVDDSRGGEGDESVELTLELVSPMDFSHLIDLNPDGGGVSSSLTITIIDDDEAQSSILGLTTIIGIAVAGVAIVILMFLIILVSLCICRFNANRQGFYITEEDKTANPPSMLRYSASLRSISSQAVVPIIDGKGQLAEKENEFYV